MFDWGMHGIARMQFVTCHIIGIIANIPRRAVLLPMSMQVRSNTFRLRLMCTMMFAGLRSQCPRPFLCSPPTACTPRNNVRTHRSSLYNWTARTAWLEDCERPQSLNYTATMVKQPKQQDANLLGVTAWLQQKVGRPGVKLQCLQDRISSCCERLSCSPWLPIAWWP